MLALLITSCVLSLIAIALILINRPKAESNVSALSTKVDGLTSQLNIITANLKEDFLMNRDAIEKSSKENRSELSDVITKFRDELRSTLGQITDSNRSSIEQINNTLDKKITALIDKVEENNKTNRYTIVSSLKDFSFEQRSKFDELKGDQKDQAGKTIDQLEKITAKVEEKLNGLNEQAKTDNNLMRQALEASFRGFRDTYSQSVEAMNKLQKEKFEQLEARQSELIRKTEEKLEALNTQAKTDNNQMRESLGSAFKGFQETFDKNVSSFNNLQHEKFGQLEARQGELVQKTEEKLTALNNQAKADNNQMREALGNAFKGFQEAFDKNVESFNNLQREKFGHLEEKQVKLVESTEKKLEEMRQTVDEKLQKTLNERLGQSFALVSQQLESVQNGLGEMKTLAQDVGGLKKVLSNVKMRGGFGEVQLHMLLENILAPEQYDTNVATKKGSSERVEFAVKFPNKEGEREFVWLPIDAKFPKDAYENLQNAYDTGDPTAIEAAQKSLEAVIRKMAKDICDKYLDAPNTTNFGIMFLPFEGLFAEVVRKASLLEDIQRDCQVIITGPTTLAVILNSLQMGFRTLAIQKRSNEVWTVLSGVKKEFNQFGNLLERAQNNIQTGLNQLDDVVGVRTRAIQRKLRGVEVLDSQESTVLVAQMIETEIEKEEE